MQFKIFRFRSRKKKKVVERYYENLSDIKRIKLNYISDDIGSNYAYFPVLFKDDTGKLRNKIYNALREANIYARKYFYPLTSDQACFKNKYKHIDIPNARYISKNILTLPLYADLEIDEVDQICKIIKESIR